MAPVLRRWSRDLGHGEYWRSGTFPLVPLQRKCCRVVRLQVSASQFSVPGFCVVMLVSWCRIVALSTWCQNVIETVENLACFANTGEMSRFPGVRDAVFWRMFSFSFWHCISCNAGCAPSVGGAGFFFFWTVHQLSCSCQFRVWVVVDIRNDS